jgi:pimeloyl-ACP methyl ester carboxylesterase
MRRALLLTLPALLLLTFGVSADTTQITVRTDDGLELHAWMSPSPAEGEAPLVVMLPMMGKTFRSWTTLIDSTRAYFETRDTGVGLGPFPHFLRLDLRGHGESIVMNDEDTVSYTSMGEADFAKMPSDVAAMVTQVRKDYGDRISQVYIVGASIGANAAMMSTMLLPDIEKVALLSPGVDYRGLKPMEAFKKFDGGILMMVSRGDVNSYESCQTLATSKNEGWILKAYPGDLHGTALINADGRAMTFLLNWLFGPKN